MSAFIARDQRETFNKLIIAAERKYGISYDLLVDGTSRSANIVRVKQMLFYLLREKHDFTLSGIGLLFKRDHTTVLHGVQVVRNRQEYVKEAEELLLDVIPNSADIRPTLVGKMGITPVDNEGQHGDKVKQ